ncbi:MAG: hypothetical protein HY842_05680 [Bacteroidetes bacterium]|nr:hypothetical protein [Bacteroidota bacterium]
MSELLIKMGEVAPKTVLNFIEKILLQSMIVTPSVVGSNQLKDSKPLST